jgi:hypothetical protein
MQIVKTPEGIPAVQRADVKKLVLSLFWQYAPGKLPEAYREVEQLLYREGES